MPVQLTHYTNQFEKQNFPITIVCENVTNAPNIGSLFRTSDAFGVEKIIFCGSTIPLGRKMTKTSRATEKVVNYEVRESLTEVISDLKKENYQLIALEITTNSQPLKSHIFNTQIPVALIIGDENFGISEAILRACNAVVHISMYGQNSSMNVVQATSIALYELTKQFNFH